MIIELNPLWFTKNTANPMPAQPILNAEETAEFKALGVPLPLMDESLQDSKTAKAVETKMANIVTDVEKGIEVAAADVLKVITWVGKEAPKVEAAEPQVVAALGVLLGAVNTALVGAEGAVAAPLNIALDVATLSSLKAVWPDVTKFLATLGIKL